MLDGEVTLRDNTDYDSSKSLVSIKEDFSSYFKGVRYYAMGGNHAVQLDLTGEGFEKLNAILLTMDSSANAYFFVGETNLNLQLTGGTALESSTLYFSSEAGRAQSFAILLDSAISGNVLANSYNTDKAGSGTELIVSTPVFGEYAAIYVLAALIAVLAAAIILPIIRYKKLGLVNAISALIYALVAVVSLLLLKIQLTVAGAFIVALGLALLTFTNLKVFLRGRTATLPGRTSLASVKEG